MTVLSQSQRDPRWKSQKLGYSTASTLNDYGCTITCIGAIAGLTPDEVNNRMKAAGAFQKDLVLWTKIQAAIPWLQFVYRYYTYDNTVTISAIRDYGFVLVEVDFDGIISTPNDRHWIVYKGNKQAMDPWPLPGGNDVPTSKYPIAKGLAVFKRIGDPPQTQPSIPQPSEGDELSMEEKKQLEDKITFLERSLADTRKSEQDNIATKLRLESELNELKQKYDELSTRFQETVDSNNGWAEKVYDAEKARDKWKSKYEELQNDKESSVNILQEQCDEKLQTKDEEIRDLTEKLGAKKSIQRFGVSELIVEVIRRVKEVMSHVKSS